MSVVVVVVILLWCGNSKGKFQFFFLNIEGPRIITRILMCLLLEANPLLFCLHTLINHFILRLFYTWIRCNAGFKPILCTEEIQFCYCIAVLFLQAISERFSILFVTLILFITDLFIAFQFTYVPPWMYSTLLELLNVQMCKTDLCYITKLSYTIRSSYKFDFIRVHIRLYHFQFPANEF